MIASPAGAGVSPIAFGPAAETFALQLRVGNEAVLAWIAQVTGASAVDLFTPVVALWVGLLAGPAAILARTLRGGRVVPLVIAIAVVTSAVATTQAFAQNAASLLGESLALLATAALAARPRLNRAGLPALVVGAIGLAGVAAVYPETVPLFGPVWLALVVRGGRGGLAGTGVLVVLAVALAPFAFARAIAGLLNLTAISVEGGARSSPEAIVFGLLGPLGRLRDLAPGGVAGVVVGVVLAGIAAAVVVGLVAAIRSRRSRAVGLGAAGTLVACLALGLSATEYTFHRAVDIAWPILLIGTGAGLAVLVQRRLRVPVIVVAGGFVALNVAIAGAIATQPWGARVVGPAYAEVGAEVGAVGGDEGERVIVVTGDLFEQLWLSYELREDDRVSYATLRGDLGYRADSALTDAWDGRRDDLVVVGTDVAVAFEPAAEIAVFAQFRVLDTTRGDVLAVMPAGPLSAWSPTAPAASCGSRVRVLAWGASAEAGSLTVRDGTGTQVVLPVEQGFTTSLDLPGVAGGGCTVELVRSALG